jgi:hypothetical protein
MATRRRKPSRLYLVPTLGSVVLTVAWWALESWASNAAWFQKIPFGWLLALLAAFGLGLLAEDFVNSDSWVRQFWAERNRLFMVERLTPASHQEPDRHWLQLVLMLRFTRNVKPASLVIRVHHCLNLPHAERTFVLLGEKFDGVRDQTKKFSLAIIPLERTDGRALGHSVWGDTHESGHPLFEGSDNVVEIEMRAGWRRQQEYLFVGGMNKDSHEFGRVFLVAGRRPGLGVTTV